jgi:hypothetical protein
MQPLSTNRLRFFINANRYAVAVCNPLRSDPFAKAVVFNDVNAAVPLQSHKLIPSEIIQLWILVCVVNDDCLAGWHFFSHSSLSLSGWLSSYYWPRRSARYGGALAGTNQRKSNESENGTGKPTLTDLLFARLAQKCGG